MAGLESDERMRLLRGVELFRSVSDEDLAAVADLAVEAEFETGRSIVRQGDVGTGLYLIVSGRGRVVRDGRTLAHLGPGGFFGELSVLDGQPRVAAVVAEEPCVCLALASWDLDSILIAHPHVAVAILRGVAARLRAVTEESAH